MKVTSIMNLMKKSRCIELSELSGKQWVSNGEAAYAIHCLPPLDEDQFCSIAGITEKAAKAMDINTDARWYDHYNDAFGDAQKFNPVERRTGLMYVTKGSVITLFVSATDHIFIDTKYLKPLPDYDKADNLSFFIRKDSDGGRVLQVKAGLTSIAIISEWLPDEAFATDLGIAAGIVGEMLAKE